jgi:hypothetical protein
VPKNFTQVPFYSVTDNCVSNLAADRDANSRQIKHILFNKNNKHTPLKKGAG